MGTTGRPREFEDDEILDIAIELFTESGYSDTSINELLYAFDMGRQSLYNAFGSKHELFLSALDQYVEQDALSLLVLRGRDAGWDAIERYFEARVEQLSGARPRHGCLIVNSVLDRGSVDPAVEQRGRSLVLRMTNALEYSVRRAIAAGDLSGDTEPRVTARFLVVTALGLTVLAKSGLSQEIIGAHVDAALALIR